MSHDFPLGISTAVYRVFRGANGPVGLLAQFQYETDAEKWCELLPFDRDWFHILVTHSVAPKVYGLVGRATERDSLERIQDEMDSEVSPQQYSSQQPR